MPGDPRHLAWPTGARQRAPTPRKPHEHTLDRRKRPKPHQKKTLPTAPLFLNLGVFVGIGRSSQLDHSKELDLYFSELYWSNFLGSFQKTVTETKRLVIFVCFRTEIESAHANRLFITKLPLMIGAVFYKEKNFDILVHVLVGHRYGSEVINCDKSHNCDFLSQFRNCDFGPELCPTKISKFFSP